MGSQHKAKVRNFTTFGVFVEIEKKKENNLGMPLAKGTVRVYKHDNEGNLQFVGEDAIDHTPEKEKIIVKLGEAFDVVGSRKMTEWKKLAFGRYEAAYEVSLKNHKKEDVVVKVVEPIPGDWTMVDSSHTFKKSNAFTTTCFPRTTLPRGARIRDACALDQSTRMVISSMRGSVPSAPLAAIGYTYNRRSPWFPLRASHSP